MPEDQPKSTPSSAPKRTTKPAFSFHHRTTPPRTNVPLAQRHGQQISKTDVKRIYKLKNVHLTGILPTSVRPNPFGGAYDCEKYNLSDVQRLVELVREGGDWVREEEEGEEGEGKRIGRTKALREFKLKPAQLDQIPPLSISPSRYPGGRSARIYDWTQVRALATSLGLAQAPNRSARKRERAPSPTPGYQPLERRKRRKEVVEVKRHVAEDEKVVLVID
ncbi:hypothetical protein T439DRAFT_355803 [Meredithblackwellia eburnea MCA 4105]